MILDDNFPPDNRVEKEIITLCESGFEVYILCFAFADEPLIDNYFGATVIRHKINRAYSRKLRGLTNTILDVYTPFWTKLIVKFVAKYEITVLHIHDLYLVGAGLKAAKRLNHRVKVVGDLHENYADALKYYKFSNTFPGNILISKKKWKKTERVWVSQLDRAVVVVEEMKNRISDYLDPAKIAICENCVDISSFLAYENDLSIAHKYADKFVISYIGAFDWHRGLSSLLKAISLLNDIPELMLCLVGSGKIKAELIELAKQLGIEKKVMFEGWIAPEILPNYFKISDVGIIPHLKSVQTDNSSPNKLYQYMLLETPVIATNCNSLKRVVSQENCGLIYESGNHIELAEQIRNLYMSSNQRKKMGANGKKAVYENYNWTVCSNRLVDMYKHLT